MHVRLVLKNDNSGAARHFPSTVLSTYFRSKFIMDPTAIDGPSPAGKYAGEGDRRPLIKGQLGFLLPSRGCREHLFRSDQEGS